LTAAGTPATEGRPPHTQQPDQLDEQLRLFARALIDTAMQVHEQVETALSVEGMPPGPRALGPRLRTAAHRGTLRRPAAATRHAAGAEAPREPIATEVDR